MKARRRSLSCMAPAVTPVHAGHATQYWWQGHGQRAVEAGHHGPLKAISLPSCPQSYGSQSKLPAPAS